MIYEVGKNREENAESQLTLFDSIYYFVTLRENFAYTQKVKKALLYILLTLSPFLSLTQTKIKSFYFETDKSVPTPYSQNQLALFKKSLQQGEVTIFEIYSYTDSIGSSKYNDTLAKKRLAYVSTFLGVDPNSGVVLKPFGMDRKYDVKNYKSWRRVDIYYGIAEIADTIIEMEPIIQQEPKDSIKPIVKEVPVKKKIKEINPFDESVQTAIPYILNIGFIEGTAKIDKKSYSEIKKLYTYLVANPDKKIIIRGHVCCGNNMRISKNRAKAVYKELKRMGIDPKRLSYLGLSNKEPLVFPEKTDADRQRNRRVDVKFKPADM